MDKYISDTMALVLRLENRKMPKRTNKIFEKAEEDEVEIYVPIMVVAEIGYLSEKRKIDTNIEEVRDYSSRNKNIRIKEITFDSIEKAFSISDIPELHDRIIAGVAMELNATILTNDPVIEKSTFLKTVWK